MRHGSVDNHETRIFSHDTVIPILVEQVITRDDVEIELIGVKRSQVVEDKCDNTLRTDSAHFVVSMGGAGFSDMEPSNLDFHNQLQEIDREIARYDSSEEDLRKVKASYKLVWVGIHLRLVQKRGRVFQ